MGAVSNTKITANLGAQKRDSFCNPQLFLDEESKVSKKEPDFMKKLGIQKIIPSSQTSKMRHDTITSRFTDRSSNTNMTVNSYVRRE